MPKATLWPHIVDLDQVERAAALIARFGGAYGRLFYRGSASKMLSNSESSGTST